MRRKTPVVVKPWQSTGFYSGIAGGDSGIDNFEDCDGLGWGLYIPGKNPIDEDNRKCLFANNNEGKDSLLFYLKD